MNNAKVKSKNNKASASNGRRRRQGRTNAGNNQAVRRNNNISSVQRSLQVRKSGMLSPNMRAAKIVDIAYARCRLDPFNSGPSMGLPDSNATPKLVFDHRSVQDFSVNGNASLLILPTLPFGACIKPDTTVANNINIEGAGIVQLTSAANVASWIPINWYQDAVPADNTTMSPTSILTSISSKLRVVGVAYRLICTSPSINISGIVETVDSEMTVGSREINAVAVQQTNPNEANPVTWTAGTVDIRMVNMNLGERVQATVPKTVQQRPEVQPQGILKHSGPYMWDEIHESPIVPVSGFANNGAFFTFGAGTNFQKFGAVTCWADGFSVKRIRISTPQSVSFRLETLVCVEYVLTPNSPFARIATPRTKVDSRSVELVDTAISAMPASVTPGQTVSFINKFLRTISQAAPIAGAPFGPTGIAIGTSVSAISDALANIL